MPRDSEVPPIYTLLSGFPGQGRETAPSLWRMIEQGLGADHLKFLGLGVDVGQVEKDLEKLVVAPGES